MFSLKSLHRCHHEVGIQSVSPTRALCVTPCKLVTLPEIFFCNVALLWDAAVLASVAHSSISCFNSF